MTVADVSRTAAARARWAAARVRAASRSEGAGDSGLSQLTAVHAVHFAGDVLFAVALAGTLFFSVPLGEARGRVALYLLITMLPFAVVAPVIGPLLDRLRHGRRWALAATMGGRAFLAWSMAGAVGGLALYPAAFGVLVLSKGYGVARGAALPRVMPPGLSLVRANARLSLAGLALMAVAAPLGVGVSALFGYRWTLRLTAVVFAVAAVLALRLPAVVDSAKGEVTARLRAEEPVPAGLSARQEQRTTRPLRIRRTSVRPSAGSSRLRWVGPAVVASLRTVCALRGLLGFLTLFLAFLLRADGSGNLALAAVAVAAGVGGFAGNAIGARLPDRAPESVLTLLLGVVVGSCVATAIWFSLTAAILLALVASLAGSLGKLALDAVLQRDVAEVMRASAFARSETALQLAWVVGGGIGIALPLNGTLGMGVAAALLGVVLADALVTGFWPRLAGARFRRPAR